MEAISIFKCEKFTSHTEKEKQPYQDWEWPIKRRERILPEGPWLFRQIRLELFLSIDILWEVLLTNISYTLVKILQACKVISNTYLT